MNELVTCLLLIDITYMLYLQELETEAEEQLMSKNVTTELQDLTHLDWSESATASATGGSYLKARSGDGAEATYYKPKLPSGITTYRDGR